MEGERRWRTPGNWNGWDLEIFLFFFFFPFSFPFFCLFMVWSEFLLCFLFVSCLDVGMSDVGWIHHCFCPIPALAAAMTTVTTGRWERRRKCWEEQHMVCSAGHRLWIYGL